MESLDTKESSKMDILMGKVEKEKNKEVFTIITLLNLDRHAFLQLRRSI